MKLLNTAESKVTVKVSWLHAEMFTFYGLCSSCVHRPDACVYVLCLYVCVRVSHCHAYGPSLAASRGLCSGCYGCRVRMNDEIPASKPIT